MNRRSELALILFASFAFSTSAWADDAQVLAPPETPSLATPETTVEKPTTTLRGSAMKKFDAGQELSAEEYRSLEAGCAGFESHHVFFQDIATITMVYKDSPAARAGIKIGDKILAPEKVEDAKFEEDPSISRQKVVCGRAGTPVDLTVLRDGKPVKLTLIRMNIEDIKEAKYRHSWERILRQLGYPTDGNFSGTSFNDMTPTE